MAEPSPIDEFLWTKERYASVLRLDHRTVARALADAPSVMRGARRLWHVRDGMPAIFAPKAARVNPNTMSPKDRLDYIRSQLEFLRLKREMRKIFQAEEVERTVGEAFKALAHGLSAIPDNLERELGLGHEAITALHKAMDAAREALYTNLMSLLEGSGGALHQPDELA